MKNQKDYKPKLILEKPIAGWSIFTFGNFPISYIEDFPLIILDAIYVSLKNNTEFCVTLDAEGWTYTILSPEGFNIEIITRKEETKIVELDKTFKEFCLDFIYSVEHFIDDFSAFSCDYDSEDEIKENKEKILEIIKNIKEVTL